MRKKEDRKGRGGIKEKGGGRGKTGDWEGKQEGRRESDANFWQKTHLLVQAQL
jgi:hypothetical protein